MTEARREKKRAYTRAYRLSHPRPTGIVGRVEVGRRFGRLVVESFAGKRNHSHYYLCSCDCGTKKEISKYSLQRGETTSCGCFQKEQARNARMLRPYESIYRDCIKCGDIRGFESTLTYEEFVEFTSQSECHYCGSPIAWSKHKSNSESVSTAYNLDRKDTSIGYTKDNCVACCGRCNRGRMDAFSYEEWLIMGKALKAFRQGTACYSILDEAK